MILESTTECNCGSWFYFQSISLPQLLQFAGLSSPLFAPSLLMVLVEVSRILDQSIIRCKLMEDYQS